MLTIDDLQEDPNEYAHAVLCAVKMYYEVTRGIRRISVNWSLKEGVTMPPDWLVKGCECQSYVRRPLSDVELSHFTTISHFCNLYEVQYGDFCKLLSTLSSLTFPGR